MASGSQKALLKGRDVRVVGRSFVKKRSAVEVAVQKTVLEYFEGNPEFKVPRIDRIRTTATKIATEYIQGITATRFLQLLDHLIEFSLLADAGRARIENLKVALINKMLKDLRYFHSCNSELRERLRPHLTQYPYLSKLEESCDAVCSCFGYRPSLRETGLLERDLERIAGELTRRATFVFRDAITDNVIVQDPELEGVSQIEAAQVVFSQVVNDPEYPEFFEDRIYHVDFETANRCVTHADDIVHVLEHEMCALKGRRLFGEVSRVKKDKLYHLTLAARALRSWSRRCVYLMRKMKGQEDRYPDEHPEFYLDKVFEALNWLGRCPERVEFPDLRRFLLNVKSSE